MATKATDELTLENYIAHKLTLLEHGIAPHWLCTDKHYKQKALHSMRVSFEEWKANELRAHAARQIPTIERIKNDKT